jgi:heterodisulfide reductase subunit C
MTAFLAENIGTILVGLILAGIVAAIIAQLLRDQRRGKCPGCGDCGGSCPHTGSDKSD